MKWHSIFEYRDGRLFWKIKPKQSSRLDNEAGWHNGKGHLRVTYKQRGYMVHRIIYEMFHGPASDSHEIDHIDGIRDNNRIENLRLVTSSQNNWNSRNRKHNTSGLKGVYWENRKQKWRAQIGAFGKRKHLGYFATKEEAYAARLGAEKELHGEFAPSEERKLVVA